MERRDPWGTFEVQEGQAGRWRIGPLVLWIRREPHEWRLGMARGSDPLEDTFDAEVPCDPIETPEPAPTRYATADPSPAITVTPRLADRSVVARFEQPLVVPAEEEILVYLTAPIWLRIGYGASDRALTELPVSLLSDAWLGRTIAGELAYATKIPCQTDEARLPRRRHRAVTAIRVDNRAASPLELNRLALPLPRLGLLAAGDSLWTPDVRLVRRTPDDLADLEISSGPPVGAPDAKEIAPPREQASASSMVRAFGHLFK